MMEVQAEPPKAKPVPALVVRACLCCSTTLCNPLGSVGSQLKNKKVLTCENFIYYKDAPRNSLDQILVEDALRYIFGANVVTNVGDYPPLLGVCTKCGHVLAEVYRIHREFRSLCKTKSWLHELIQLHQGPCLTKLKLEMKDASAQVEDGFLKLASTFFPDYPNQQNQTSQNRPFFQPPFQPIVKPEPVEFQEDAADDIDMGEPEPMVDSPSSDMLEMKMDVAAEEIPPKPKPKRRKSRKYHLTCEECGKEFHTANRNAVSVHIAYVHRKMYRPGLVCKICGKPHSWTTALKVHLTTHLSKEEKEELSKAKARALCTVCGLEMLEGSLKAHMRVHDVVKPDPVIFKCDKCPAQFLTKKTLQLHGLVHEEGGYCPYTCECGEGFKRAGQFRSHQTVCAMKADERPHQCGICQKRFKLKQHWELHLIELHKVPDDEAREIVYPGLPKRPIKLSEVKQKRKKTKKKKKEKV